MCACAATAAATCPTPRPRSERSVTPVPSIDLTKTPSFRLDGKRALVTGGGRGIGLAAASALAQAGAEVTLAARTRDEIEAAAQAIAARGDKAVALPLDVTDLDAVRRTIAAAEPFDVLVNNAGTNRPAFLMEVKVEDFDAIFALNVRAAFFMEKPCARRATAWPMSPPPPTKPMVFPQTKEPSRWLDWPPGNFPARTSRSPSMIRRATASISPKVRSAVASVVTGGTTVTGSRCAVAAATSMFEGEMDCAATSRSFGLAAITSRSMRSWCWRTSSISRWSRRSRDGWG